MSGHLVESFKVSDTLSAYRVVVAVSGTARTVSYPDTTGVLPIGITIDDADSTALAIPVQLNGIAKLNFSDTVTAGGLVGFDTSGRGVAFSYGTTATAATILTGIIGVLVGPSIADTAAVAEVLIHPQLVFGV